MAWLRITDGSGTAQILNLASLHEASYQSDVLEPAAWKLGRSQRKAAKLTLWFRGEGSVLQRHVFTGPDARAAAYVLRLLEQRPGDGGCGRYRFEVVDDPAALDGRQPQVVSPQTVREAPRTPVADRGYLPGKDVTGYLVRYDGGAQVPAKDAAPRVERVYGTERRPAVMLDGVRWAWAPDEAAAAEMAAEFASLTHRIASYDGDIMVWERAG